MSACVRQVIDTELARRGDGTASPIRIVRQIYSVDGELIAEVDPVLKPVLAELRRSLESRGEAAISSELCQRLMAVLPEAGA